MHPRNAHQGRYDFPALVAAVPELERFLRPSPSGDPTIDFADPLAVTTLNRALLRRFYDISTWELPPGYLCPPIPGRADYIHHVAHLPGLAGNASARVLDIGVGANCIYPIIGRHAYGWSFVGSDIDPIALSAAARTITANPTLREGVELRRQSEPLQVFRGILQPGEHFDLAICNPPFHASAFEAEAGTQRKLRNLAAGKKVALARNFGGTSNELWCAGGERAFVRRMIAESAEFRRTVGWFTALVAKSENLPDIERALARVQPTEVRTIAMAQGQKQSRIVAWRF